MALPWGVSAVTCLGSLCRSEFPRTLVLILSIDNELLRRLAQLKEENYVRVSRQ